MNILIIEDDILLSGKLKEIFERKTITNRVKTIYCFNNFLLELPIISSYDILLVDINLGDKSNKNGIDIIKIIRNKNINIPIVIMSSYTNLEWLEIAFNHGANDYIIKPFRLQELEIRILKWFKIYLINLKYNINDNYLYYFGLKYCINNNEVYFNENKLDLTKKNKYLLFIFIGNNEILLSERFLISKIYGDLDFFNKRNIRIDILRLKRALSLLGIHNWIKNIRGEGYILIKN